MSMTAPTKEPHCQGIRSIRVVSPRGDVSFNTRPTGLDGTPGQSLQKILGAGLITVGRRFAATDVLHRDHHFRVELLHHISGFRTVVNLGATTNAEDQHIRAPQQHLVFGLECCGGAAEMGEVQSTLLPAPDDAIAKSATAEAVVGSGKAFKAQAFDAVATRAGQKTALAPPVRPHRARGCWPTPHRP